jgi:hypothetical protein
MLNIFLFYFIKQDLFFTHAHAQDKKKDNTILQHDTNVHTTPTNTTKIRIQWGTGRTDSFCDKGMGLG